MNDLALFGDKRMTVKEVAMALGYDPRTIQLKVKELFPEIVEERQTTYLNETQVTAVKMACEKKFAASTDLEMMMLDRQVSEWKTRKIEELQAALAIAAPKAELADRLTSSDDAIDIGTVSRVLALPYGRNTLFSILRGKKILMADNRPYQEYMDRGYFRVIEEAFEVNGKTKVNFKTLVYQKGVEYLSKILKEADK